MTTFNYAGQSAKSISVTYTGMPAGAAIVFVNQESGAQTPASAGALSGDGSADIPIPDLKSGEYHLLAQKSGQSLAQTVNFYLN
jgi:hypothetical protein